MHNAGNCNPRIVAAISEQAARLGGVSNLFYTEPAMRLAERLSESSLGGRVFLANSGTEANECAIKLARKHAHARGIARAGDRHAGQRLSRPHPGRAGRDAPSSLATISSVRSRAASSPSRGTIRTRFAAAVGERTAAVIVEPIQGEAGVWPIADEVLVAAREACDAGGAILVFDEIQTGMGRTGSLWAYERLPARPDVITAAKALGGGLPVGACVTVPELGEVLALGDHGSTFAGGPVAAAAALAALAEMDDPEPARECRGARRAALRGARRARSGRRRPWSRADGGRHARDGIDAAAVHRRRARAGGLVINVPGPGMLRFLPPLTVSAPRSTRRSPVLAQSGAGRRLGVI